MDFHHLTGTFDINAPYSGEVAIRPSPGTTIAVSVDAAGSGPHSYELHVTLEQL